MSNFVNGIRCHGLVLDICDHIISVSGLSTAFSGELIRFQSLHGDIIGFVWNIEDNICKIPLIGGSQTSLRIGDYVYRTGLMVQTRCGFGVLGQIINPLGDLLADSDLSYRESQLSLLFKNS